MKKEIRQFYGNIQVDRFLHGATWLCTASALAYAELVGGRDVVRREVLASGREEAYVAKEGEGVRWKLFTETPLEDGVCIVDAVCRDKGSGSVEVVAKAYGNGAKDYRWQRMLEIFGCEEEV